MLLWKHTSQILHAVFPHPLYNCRDIEELCDEVKFTLTELKEQLNLILLLYRNEEVLMWGNTFLFSVSIPPTGFTCTVVERCKRATTVQHISIRENAPQLQKCKYRNTNVPTHMKRHLHQLDNTWTQFNNKTTFTTVSLIHHCKCFSECFKSGADWPSVESGEPQNGRPFKKKLFNVIF